MLSLTIIGIVAAIAFPSLLGGANERAFETQKKALYTRFSQSLSLLPSLNGYGTLEGILSQGWGDDLVEQSVTVDTAAESFIRDGLSKVMKITNICAIPHGTANTEAAKILSDCGLPDKITTLTGYKIKTLNLSDITSLVGFNPKMNDAPASTSNPTNIYRQLNTNAGAFETVNRESVLVYYNPNCEADLDEAIWHRFQPKVCANFVYDLNGKKGPNTMGKDIGFITAIYSTNPVDVAPNPYTNFLSGITYANIGSSCKALDENAKVPNKHEAMALGYNAYLMGGGLYDIWSNTAKDSNTAWRITFGSGAITPDNKTLEHYVICIKR